MDEENLQEKIEDILKNMPENFSILEDQIDIDLQMEYFDYSNKIQDDLDPEVVLKNKEWLFMENISIEDKKRLLSQLAIIADVDSYRTIEKYLKDPDEKLKDWSVLAFQQCRMILESSLLEEKKVFISTGLGGKQSKLRYFMVLISKSGKEFEEIQKKVIKNEFDVVLKKNRGELEEINYDENFSTMLFLLPLKASIKDIIKNAVDECNRYGDFLNTNFIITNVKRLTLEEIKEFIEKNE